MLAVENHVPSRTQWACSAGTTARHRFHCTESFGLLPSRTSQVLKAEPLPSHRIRSPVPLTQFHYLSNDNHK